MTASPDDLGGEQEGAGDGTIEFRDHAVALSYLRTLLRCSGAGSVLRRALAGADQSPLLRLDDASVLERLADHLVTKRLRLRELTDSVIVVSGQPETATEEPTTAARSTSSPTDETYWIAVELIDEDGTPVPGERFRIVLPDGSERQGQLDSRGSARVDSRQPGTCSVFFPDRDARDWHPI